MIIEGRLNFANCSRIVNASVTIHGNGYRFNYDDQHHYYETSDLTFEDPIPGLTVEVRLPEGHVFIPNDKNFRWPHKSNNFLHTVETMERDWRWVISGALCIPLILAALHFVVIPYTVNWGAHNLPRELSEHVGEESLESLDQLLFAPSKLSDADQHQLRERWAAVTEGHPSGDDYTLHLRSFRGIPNAFALFGRNVVITDRLAELTKEHPGALEAIILHEIGHIEHRHVEKATLDSLAYTTLAAVIFGDVSVGGEIVLSGSLAVFATANSRSAELEADDYALERLSDYGFEPEVFATALELITKDINRSSDDDESNFLSTHPSTSERILRARNYQ